MNHGNGHCPAEEEAGRLRGRSDWWGARADSGRPSGDRRTSPAAPFDWRTHAARLCWRVRQEVSDSYPDPRAYPCDSREGASEQHFGRRADRAWILHAGHLSDVLLSGSFADASAGSFWGIGSDHWPGSDDGGRVSSGRHVPVHLGTRDFAS